MARRPVNSPYTITQEFGVPTSTAKFGRHSGVDYAVPTGRPIYAPISGTLTNVVSPTGGNMVVIQSGGLWHRLMHNSAFSRGNGAVNEGDQVAKAGSTGLSTGPHCHWDINREATYPTSFAAFIDPFDWLNAPQPAPAPAPALQPYQRIVGSNGVYRRDAPNRSGAILDDWPAGDVVNFKGYTKGETVNGNSTWFVGRFSGGYCWSGAFTDTSTNGLENLDTQVPAPAPAPTPTPAPEPIPDHSQHVIDISIHNRVTDFAAVKASVRGVITKAGHTGKSYGGTPLNGDPSYPVHRDNLGDKLLGAYWYGYATMNPTDEAVAFDTVVGVVPETFTYWLDIEELDGKTKAEVNQWCQTFLNVIEERIGRKCGLYMNRDWFNNYITAETKGSRPIWLAHYDTPEFSNPVPNQVAHQFTSSGKVNGIEGNVDINAVNDKFFIPPASPPPPDEPPVPPNDGRLDKIDKFLKDTFRSYQ